jgi:hypothetical protein
VEVLGRSSPASKNNDIDAAIVAAGTMIEKSDCRYEIAVGAVALYARRSDKHVEAAVTPLQYLKDVADCSTYGRGDHAYPARKKRQLTFVRRIEEPFRSQPFHLLLISQLQVADLERLHRFDEQLVVTMWRIDLNSAAHANFEAIFGFIAQQPVPLVEEDASDLRLTILEGEVEVPVVVPFEIRYLALNPEIPQISFEQALDPGSQLADRQRRSLGLHRKKELRDGIIHAGRSAEAVLRLKMTATHRS